MNSILHEQRSSCIAAAILTIFMGVLLVARPGTSVQFLCMLLGGAVLVSGVIYILGWISRRSAGYPVFFLLPGILLCALGGWMLTRPAQLVILIQYIFGLILLLHGLVDVQGALALAGQRYDRWWLDLLLAALTVLLGVVILLNPFGAFASLVILIGLSLVFDGVSDLYIIWRLSRLFQSGE